MNTSYGPITVVGENDRCSGFDVYTEDDGTLFPGWHVFPWSHFVRAHLSIDDELPLEGRLTQQLNLVMSSAVIYIVGTNLLHLLRHIKTQNITTITIGVSETFSITSIRVLLSD